MITKFCCFIAVVLYLQLSSAGVAQTPVVSPTVTPTVQPAILYADAVYKTFEISNLKDDPVRVELVLQPNVKAIEVSLADVALGDRHDQSLMTLFGVEMEKPPVAAKTSSALLIKVNSNALRSGTYKLHIKVLPVDSDNTKSPQSLFLEVKLPSAEIKALDKVVVHHTTLSPVSDDPVGLSLTEISGKVRLTDVKIVQTYATSDNVATSQSISFAPVAEIAPHTTGKSKITVNGEIPLGTSTIAAMVSAPQLEKPIFLTIEVRSRRTKLIIVLVMLLGLVLGLVARVWTKQRVEAEEARLKAIDAAGIVKRALDAHPDDVFQQQVKPPFDALVRTIRNGTVETLNDQIVALNAALPNALKDLDVRRANVLSQLEALNRIVKNASSLPTGIKETVVVDANELQQARAAFDLDNVAGAKKMLQPLISNLGSKLGKGVEEWRAQMRSLLDQVMQISAFLDPNLSAGLEADKTKIRAELDVLAPTTGDSSVENISTLAESVKRVGTAIDTLLKNRVPVQLASQFSVLKALLNSKPLKNEETVARFLETAEKLPGQFAKWAEHPKAGIDESSKALSDLKVHWQEALLSQVDDSDAETKKSIQALLNNNQYVGATQVTVSTLKAKEKLLGGTGAAMLAQPLVTSSIPLLDLFESRASEAAFTIFSTVRKQTVPPSLEELRADSMRDLFKAKAVRFAIASIIIFAIGYGLFANLFVGTFSELMTIFVWAFGLNISVDTVMDSINVRKIG